MKIVSLRADGNMHRIWEKAEQTAHPWTYLVPEHSPVIEANGNVWSSPYPVIAFFYPTAFFQIFMLLKPNITDYYCNVILPSTFQRDVTFVDLDLDVIIENRTLKLVDEAEFVARRSMYLEDWIMSARQASTELRKRFEDGWGPFCPATADTWRGYVGL